MNKKEEKKKELKRKLKLMKALSFLPCKWGFHRWVIFELPSCTKFSSVGKPPRYYFGDWVQCVKCNLRHWGLTQMVRRERAAEMLRAAERIRKEMGKKPIGGTHFSDIFKDGFVGIDPARQSKKRRARS